jgi:hypothetical protein
MVPSFVLHAPFLSLYSPNGTDLTAGKGAGKGYCLSFMLSQRYLELENIVYIDPFSYMTFCASEYSSFSTPGTK